LAKTSAGVLLFRRSRGGLEILLVHPGGPFWARKDDGAWSIPKGEVAEGEDPLDAAKRELKEETGIVVGGDYVPLDPIRQPSGKLVRAWAVEGDCDPTDVTSMTFEMEWPPRSGLRREFPEVDRAEWFPLASARQKMLKGQRGFIDQLCAKLGTIT
jgi:predicted NUDIX family NTP pyrophosphohydrolase